jgi:hypothetical protein
MKHPYSFICPGKEIFLHLHCCLEKNAFILDLIYYICIFHFLKKCFPTIFESLSFVLKFPLFFPSNYEISLSQNPLFIIILKISKYLILKQHLPNFFFILSLPQTIYSRYSKINFFLKEYHSNQIYLDLNLYEHIHFIYLIHLILILKYFF